MGCCSSGSQANAPDAHAQNGKAENGTAAEVEALKKPEQQEISGSAAAKAAPQKRAPDRGQAPEPEEVPSIGVEARQAGPRPKRKAGTSPAVAGKQEPPPARPAPAPEKRRKHKPSLLDRSGEPESVRDESEVWVPLQKPAAANSGQPNKPSSHSMLNGTNGLAKMADRAPPQPLAQRGSWSQDEGVGADPPMLGVDVEKAPKMKPQHLLTLFSMGGLDSGGTGGLQGHARQSVEDEEFFKVQEAEEQATEIVEDRHLDFKDVNVAFG